MQFSEFFYIQTHKHLIVEKFDNMAQLLLNPDNNEKRWYDLMDEFKAAGGTMLGSGKYGRVFSHPSWKYIIKIFPYDDCYLRFVRYALKNPSPHFPKFYDKPRRILPNFSRYKHEEYMYVVKTERLYPIDKETFRKIELLKSNLGRCDGSLEQCYNDDAREEMINILRTDKGMLSFVRAYEKFMTDLGPDHPCTEDWHLNNVMKDANGDYIIIDPLWEGYSFHQMQQDAYRNAGGLGPEEYDDPDEPDPPIIPGGKREKRIKPPKPYKPAPRPSDYDNDIPF